MADRDALIKGFLKRNAKGGARGRTPPSDARSGNPKMGKHRGKGGYAIPYEQDTSRSPYRPGRRFG